MADKEISIKVITETDVNDLNDLNTLLDETKDKASESGEALQTAFEEANNRVEELTDELAQIELGEIEGDFDEVNSQLEEASQKADELGEALNNINNSELDNSKESASDLGEELENAKNKTDELSDSMGLIESTMLMDMANQIGALGDQAENSAQSLDTVAISMGQLATNTGVAEPQMKNLIAHISNVTFPQNEAIAYVNALNQMGVSADKLGDSATNMDRINDATGIGYSKVMQLTQGLQSVGIQADNLPASFNAIAYAQANVNGGADTMATVLKRQASTINEYGISVDQLVLIMQALSAQGVQGMKMGSELSKVLKDNNGDLSAVEKQLGLTTGALTNASQITSEYDGKLMKLANEEMEHKTITERLGAVYEDLALQLEPVLSPMMNLVGVIGSFGQTALAINSILKLAETFGLLETATISAKIASVGATVQNWLLAVSEWAVASPILILVAIVLILIGVLVYLYYTNEDVRNAINGVGQFFLWLGGIIYDSIIGTINYLIQAFQNFTEQIGLNTEDWIQAVLAFILFIPQLPLQVGIVLTNALMKALGFGDNFVQTMWDTAHNAYLNFQEGIDGLSDLLHEELDAMLQDALDYGIKIPGAIGAIAGLAKTAWQDGTNEKSPGDMYDMFDGELSAMESRALSTKSVLPVTMGETGKKMSDSFNPNLNIEFSNNNLDEIIHKNSRSQVNNFYFTDTVVDNEDRMNRIVEYVTKSINWDNETAGRTV